MQRTGRARQRLVAAQRDSGGGAMRRGHGRQLNLHGNRVVRDALAARGWRVALAEHRDAHNWVAWRDTFDPWLVGLLQELWA